MHSRHNAFATLIHIEYQQLQCAFHINAIALIDSFVTDNQICVPILQQFFNSYKLGHKNCYRTPLNTTYMTSYYHVYHRI